MVGNVSELACQIQGLEHVVPMFSVNPQDLGHLDGSTVAESDVLYLFRVLAENSRIQSAAR
jgi:hypothetical protein